MDKKDKEELYRILSNQVKRFKLTTFFILLIIFLFGVFVLNLFKTMEAGIFKNFMYLVVVVFCLYLLYQLIRYVLKHENLENEERDLN